MGSRLQNVIVILVFAAIVGGLTFVRQWLTPPIPPPTSPSPVSETPKGHLTLLVENKNEAQPWIDFIEHEMRPTRGHHDFWFKNDNDEPVVAGVDFVTCSKCVTVEMRLLTEEESKRYREWLPKAVAPHLVGIPGGVFNLAGMAAATLQQMDDILKDSDSWHYLKAGEAEVQTLTIPPKTAGLVRLGWEGLKIGKERVKAVLWTEMSGKNQERGSVTLEMPILFVAPLIVYPSNVKMVLGPADRKTVDFWCWSDTCAGFQLEALQKEPHPCISCACLPMTVHDFHELGKQLKGNLPQGFIFGYHVLITVVERSASGQQFDLGDFDKEIILTSKDQEFSPGVNEYTLKIQGYVQGDLIVGLGSERDKIDLGLYQISRGTAKEIPLRSTRSNLELKKFSQAPEFLEVTLDAVGKGGLEGKRWKLTVRVPPNRAPLPREGSVIVLETNDQPPRKVRIPVSGIAVRSGRPGS